MSYKIIGDSCMDLTADLKKDPHFQIIPPYFTGGKCSGNR